MQIENYFEILKNGRYLPEKDVGKICQKVKEILFEESNVLELNTPITVCGDIQGHFYELLQIFQIGGQIPNTNYVFTGNYVNRGNNSVETFELLLCYKIKYPKQITLLRGNHEQEHKSMINGFYQEIEQKYGNTNPWKFFVDVFSYLPLGAIVDGKVLCIHSGFSPELITIDSIRTIDRSKDSSLSVTLGDMLESYPSEEEDWKIQPKIGWSFGQKIVKNFLHQNELNMIVRSHQMTQEGYKIWFDNLLISIWSAPNFCNRCGNKASILELKQDDWKLQTFKETPETLSSLHPRYLFPKI